MTTDIEKKPFFSDSIRLFQTFNIVRQIAVIGGSIILAKSAMSLTNIGNFETLNFLGQFMSIFWVNGLNQAFLSIYPKVSDSQKNTFISSVFLLFLIASLFFSILLVLGKNLLLPFLIEARYIEGLYWFALYSFANVPAILIPSILLLRNNSGELLRFTIFYFVGYVTVFILNFLLGGQLINLLILLNVFAFSLLGLSGIISIKPNFNLVSRKWLKRLLLIGSPLIGYSILAGLAPLFDNWLVQRLYDDKAMFAIYRYGAREFPLTMTLAIGLGTSLLPTISNDLQRGLAQLKLRASRLYPITFGTSILLIIGSKYLFPIVFSSDFVASAPIFNIFLLIIISRMIYPQSIILALKRTRILLYISIIELFVNVVASFLLGMKFGLIGIAYGTVIAFTVEKLLQMWYLKWKYRLHPADYTSLGKFALYSLGLVIAFLLWGS
ncbi:MAG TPA: polysaccharide biosynthesis C-terminal domain-containing protein [Saprospiraceae bacterium]|nr:polysaccharide biosynthesis C-terminal domain-containing protein [Saprospiraceae bacterium]HQW54480.1 polysaccharide biosynthesis C-terminal domain-containing protein [Saprospiraceae bacterium]